MFGAKRRKKAQREAKIRLIAGMSNDALAALAQHGDNWETVEIAQAAIMVRWLAEHGYITLTDYPKTEDK